MIGPGGPSRKDRRDRIVGSYPPDDPVEDVAPDPLRLRTEPVPRVIEQVPEIRLVVDSRRRRVRENPASIFRRYPCSDESVVGVLDRVERRVPEVEFRPVFRLEQRGRHSRLGRHILLNREAHRLLREDGCPLPNVLMGEGSIDSLDIEVEVHELVGSFEMGLLNLLPVVPSLVVGYVRELRRRLPLVHSTGCGDRSERIGGHREQSDDRLDSLPFLPLDRSSFEHRLVRVSD